MTLLKNKKALPFILSAFIATTCTHINSNCKYSYRYYKDSIVALGSLGCDNSEKCIIELYSNGNPKLLTFHKNSDAFFVCFFASGVVKIIGKIDDSNLNGYQLEYYSTGILMSSILYSKGEKIESVLFDSTSHKTLVYFRYFDNEPVYVQKYHSSGVLKKVINYETTDKKNFIEKEYFQNGKLKKIARFETDELYYRNEYDSISGQVSNIYRNLPTNIKILKDSIYFSPYLDNLFDSISNYKITFKQVVKGKIIRQYNNSEHRNAKLVFGFKIFPGMKFIKETCDKSGCVEMEIGWKPDG